MKVKLPMKQGIKNFLFAFQVLALLAVFLPGTLRANEFRENVWDVTIRGTMLDESGQPMPGATVTVAGSNTGTVSDIDGNFSLTVPDQASIVVSYIGYVTQSIEVGSQTVFTIQMTADETSLYTF